MPAAGVVALLCAWPAATLNKSRLSVAYLLREATDNHRPLNKYVAASVTEISEGA